MTIEDKIITLLEHSKAKEWDLIESSTVEYKTITVWMHKTGIKLYFTHVWYLSTGDTKTYISYSMHNYLQKTYVNEEHLVNKIVTLFDIAITKGHTAMQTAVDEALNDYIKNNFLDT